MAIRIAGGDEYNARIKEGTLYYTLPPSVIESRHHYIPHSSRLEVFLLLCGEGGGGRVPQPSGHTVRLPSCCREVRFTRGLYASYQRLDECLEECLVNSFADKHQTQRIRPRQVTRS